MTEFSFLGVNYPFKSRLTALISDLDFESAIILWQEICMKHIIQTRHCNAFWQKQFICHLVSNDIASYSVIMGKGAMALFWQGLPCQGHVRQQWATDATDGRANATSYWARLAIRDSCGQHLQWVEVSPSISSETISVVSEKFLCSSQEFAGF